LTPTPGGGFIDQSARATPIEEGTVEYPQDVRYTKQHEWARVEDGRVRVGITDYAQDALGDVVYVDLPEAGTALAADQPFGEVESTKSVSDVYAPVAGTVVDRNPLLDERPELVNEQPYGDGWLILVDPTGADGDESSDGTDRLMDAAAYRAFLEQPGA
jgi:glycine cleavage system H protein